MIICIAFFAALAAVAVFPSLDLVVSGFFYKPGQGFYLADQPVFLALHWLATTGARILFIILFFGVMTTLIRRKPYLNLDGKAWLFLLFGLIIGPGLIANMGLKDHWGRARPNEVTEFGGTATFTPALLPQPVRHANGSFVSGDGAFGFYLPAFAYVVSPHRSRRVFWSCMAAGGLFGFMRIAMGAHFLSDTLFAALLILSVTAAWHALLYGRKTTIQAWQRWLFIR